jgi:BirA family biotin operon repressor/biotin-[acetyl-CoA-carboxylase] ligase
LSISAEAGHAIDGVSGEELGRRLHLPSVILLASVASTLDLAHDLAAKGAPAGTLIVADEQTSGRGRLGRKWKSAPGAGLWLTMIERPDDPKALEVLALRVGLHLAESLDGAAGGRVGVKWPNDLHLRGLKLGGILIETRWRGASPDWVAIGIGINLRVPDIESATGLPENVSRLDVLDAIVPAIRAAAKAAGHLSEGELERWSARDVARGRDISGPAPGRAAGISAAGDLLVEEGGGVTFHRSGSLIFADDNAPHL